MLSPRQTVIVREVLRTFMWTYKKADNIEYNLEILSSLYGARKVAKVPHYFNKPIILIIASIIECVLDDFVIRVQTRVVDPLPGLTEHQIIDFKYKGKGRNRRVKKMEKFDHYITISAKHNLFDRGVKFYQVLNLIKDVRNRIHIQNGKNVLDENEYLVFTDVNLRKTERVFEIVIETMFGKFPRGNIGEKEFSCKDFPYPWKLHNAR